MRIYKIFKPLFLSGLLAFLLISCDNGKSDTVLNNEVIVTGKVDSFKDTTISFSYYAHDFLKNLAHEKVKFNKDGTFKMKMKKTSPLKGWFSFGKVPTTEKFTYKTVNNKDSVMQTGTFDFRMIYVYLEPGDSINLTLDVNDIENTYAFTGKNADNNLFVNKEEYRFNDYKHKFLKNYYNPTYRSPNDYKKITDDLFKEKMAFLDDFSKEHKLSSSLIDFYRANYKAARIAAKINYPAMHASYTDQEKTELPSDYYSFMNDVQLEGSPAKYGIGYFYNQRTYLNKKYDMAKNNNPELPGLYDWLESQLPHKTWYEYMAYALGGDFTKNIYDRFGNDSPYPEMAKIVKEKYKDLEGMLEGSAVPEIVFENPEGDKINLSQLKGKFVYIDLWATWCGPCIKEIPFLQKVEKNYHGKNITFASVSIDSEKDKEKWKNFVKDRSLTGVQLYADSTAHKTIKTTFNIKNIPRFILLDPEGKVVNANAPRPSDDKLIDLFNEQNI